MLSDNKISDRRITLRTIIKDEKLANKKERRQEK